MTNKAKKPRIKAKNKKSEVRGLAVVDKRKGKGRKVSKDGRPTKYKPEYAEMAGKLCQEKGYTDKNLATHFKVNESTINNWKRRYSEFLESLKKGKDEFDSQVVEQALLKRATGYSYDETTREPVIVVKGVVDKNAIDEDETVEQAVESSLVVTKVVTKQVAPDVTAQIFWLKNRRPGRWSDVKEIKHRIEEVGKPLTIDEMKKRIIAADEVGTGLDKRSIEGSNGNSH